MSLIKRVYTDQETVITAKNLNDIQDAVIALEDSIVTIDNARSGEDITITDAAKTGLKGLRIFGKTTQNGTPTPDAPIPLVSAGDSGNITVHIANEEDGQHMDIATPNGLPGIPVADGGNYTDANGQQWICDEIDFGRGVYVRRIAEIAVTDGSKISNSAVSASGIMRCTVSRNAEKPYANEIGAVMCDKLVRATSQEQENYGIEGVTITSLGHVVFAFEGCTSKEQVAEKLADTDGIQIIYQLAEPIETPLPTEELVAYAALHTYKGYNNIFNSENAYMALEYVMDVKKYIDSVISAGLIEATVE